MQRHCSDHLAVRGTIISHGCLLERMIAALYGLENARGAVYRNMNGSQEVLISGGSIP